MTNSLIGKIKRVSLREVWQHEALDFSTWLEQNIDALNDALGIELQITDREKQVGSFSLDLLAADQNGDLVVIENQLEKSDHDHLGKVITYLSGLEAKAAIWITPDPRPEHIKAVSWLNESANEDFYLVKVEAIRIGDSKPAPLFTLIVAPSEDAREIGKAKKDIKLEINTLGKFWKQLLKHYEDKTGKIMQVSPGRLYWQIAEGGNHFCSFNYTLRKRDSSVELYVHNLKERGTPAELWEYFLSRKDQIEQALGDKLTWAPPDGKKYGRIRYFCLPKGYESPEIDWPKMQDILIDSMERLQLALQPHVEQLENEYDKWSSYSD